MMIIALLQAVLCTIHQPSMEIFELFDWILLLQKGGEVAYFGPVPNMIKQVPPPLPPLCVSGCRAPADAAAAFCLCVWARG
jgi:hypothetical protein